jgi:hypothetical protein
MDDPLTLTSSPATNASIDLMSIYQPFPLRVSGQQYDACFQIGEFSMTGLVTGSTIVILIPLKVSPVKSKGADFINAFASNIATIVASQPDLTNGYPDLQVTGMTDWNIGHVLQSDRPFYTWTNKDGTRVITMAEPIGISAENMTHIKRLPITPPEAVIKEISDTVYYKSAPPLKVDDIATKFNISQPAISLPTANSAANTEMITKFLATFGYFIAAVFAVWIALRLAVGYGKTAMEWVGNKLGDGITTATKAATTPQQPI